MVSNFFLINYFKSSVLSLLTGPQYPESGWSSDLVCRRQGKAGRAHHMAGGKECLHVMCVFTTLTNIIFLHDTYSLILLHSSVAVCLVHMHFANKPMSLYGFVNIMQGVGGKMTT